MPVVFRLLKFACCFQTVEICLLFSDKECLKDHDMNALDEKQTLHNCNVNEMHNHIIFSSGNRNSVVSNFTGMFGLF